MEWIKKHTDTVIVLGALFGGFLWLNGKFNEMEKKLVRIETVLILKGIMPDNWASFKKDDN